MAVTIVEGDALGQLGKMDADSVECVVTSPPYWNLRNYGVAGQLGSERTPSEYVAAMVQVFTEVSRVLDDTGTLWLNMGDSYTGSGCGWGGGSINEDRGTHEKIHGKQKRKTSKDQKPPPGLKRKEMVGIPWRLAFALQESGWYLRQDIIWHKPNPMPDGVNDRCTTAHEYIFLLSQRPDYYFDADAIKEPASRNSHARMARAEIARIQSERDKKAGTTGSTKGARITSTRKIGNRVDGVRANESWEAAMSLPVDMRNKRSVWTVPSRGYRGGHFATFPPELIRPCILAGCPPGGTVLDPFAGSGTTGMVAEEEGRHSILIELNPEYVKLAEDRTAQAGVFFDRD